MSDFLSFMDIAIEDTAPIGIFNVSTGEAHSIKEIFDLVVDHLGLEPRDVPTVPVDFDDVSVISLDPTETTINFDWQAKKTFSETIVSQLRWYDNYGVSDVYSHLKQK
jgi:nucleoside-diphosphate-sugar epimerase